MFLRPPKRRSTRPKVWTQVIVYWCTFRECDDPDEYLLDFRRQYREVLRERGQRRADWFAFTEAMTWVAYRIKEYVARKVVYFVLYGFLSVVGLTALLAS